MNKTRKPRCAILPVLIVVAFWIVVTFTDGSAQENTPRLLQSYPGIANLGTITIRNNEPTKVFDGAFNVIYHSSAYGQSTLEFLGIKGVSSTDKGPFDRTVIRFERGDVFYVLNNNTISSVKVVQEVHKKVTLEFEPRSSSDPISSAWYHCREQGSQDGMKIDTGSSFGGGLIGGALLGLLGTGIMYYAQGEPEPPTMTMLTLEDRDCMYAYSLGYRQSGKEKKQSSALKGGLLGTAIAVAFILSASSGN